MIQLILWALATSAIFAYSFFKFSSLEWAVVNTFIVTAIYAVAVYGNGYWLIPSFFQKSLTKYILLSVVCLAFLTVIRMTLEYTILHRLLNYKWFYAFNGEHFSFSSVTIIFAFLFGALLRISLNYFTMLQHHEEIKAQKAISELSLLKSQVQPHFLFNALNNIYYLSYTKSDLATPAISRLSDTMRYFVDEAPKDLVSLKTEIEFIKDYIEVERIRLPHAIQVSILIDQHIEKEQDSILIPSMLLIPLVENVFKHGIDKLSTANRIDISVIGNNSNLVFIVKNPWTESEVKTVGTGLANLNRRLTLLYGQAFEMTAARERIDFISRLQIPIR